MQGLHGLIERGFLIPAMAIVEIDIIHLQTFEGAIQLFFNLRCRKPLIVFVIHGKEELGSDKDLVAGYGTERLAQDPLRLSMTLFVGRIEVCNSVIECSMNTANGAFPLHSTCGC